jgi:hypothetical protein
LFLNEILEDEDSSFVFVVVGIPMFLFPFRNKWLKKKKKSAGFFMAEKTFCLTRRRTSVVH